MSWLNLARGLTALWQNKRTRAQFVGGVGALAGLGGALAAYAYWQEPLQVRLDRLTVHLPNAAGHLPKEGLRILHLSDTHFRGADWREQPKIKSILKACKGLSYDLLIHTGDFLHYDSGLPNVLTLLDALPTPRLGAYAVFGNHDYCTYSHDKFLDRAWAKFQELHRADATVPVGSFSHETVNRNDPSSALPSNGYTNGNGFTTGYSNGNGNRLPGPLNHARTLYEFGHYCANAPLDFKRAGHNDAAALEAALAERHIQTLHNCCVRLTHPEAGVDIYLAGVDDVTEGKPELRSALAEAPYDAPTILLSHNPDILVEPGIEQADLVLSGHTHGGQIVLPLLGAAHTQTNHLCRKEVSGYLRRGKTQVYITRGVGEGIPIRFGAAPQITLITVLPA